MQANTSRWYSQGFHFEPRARGEVIIFGFYVKAQQNVNQTEKKTRNNKHQICFRDDVKKAYLVRARDCLFRGRQFDPGKNSKIDISYVHLRTWSFQQSY